MSETDPHWTDKVTELRRSFDRAFAEPPAPEKTAHDDFLAIRLASESYAIRLADIAAMVADKQITRVPGRATDLIGIAGFRGTIVPVYHLGALLGRPMGEPPRWLVVASGTAVAFAFDAFDGHLRIPSNDVMPHDGGKQPRSHVREFLHADGIVRPIVDLAAVLHGIKRHHPELSTKEDL